MDWLEFIFDLNKLFKKRPKFAQFYYHLLFPYKYLFLMFLFILLYWNLYSTPALSPLIH